MSSFRGNYVPLARSGDFLGALRTEIWRPDCKVDATKSGRPYREDINYVVTSMMATCSVWLPVDLRRPAERIIDASQITTRRRNEEEDF